MKRKILSIMLALTFVITMGTGCGKNQEVVKEKTPEDMTPASYASEDDIPTDTYCIAHKVTKKNGDESVVYYPLYKADTTATKLLDSAEGYNPERYFWLDYNEDEGMIPTMYPGDKLIYKSDTETPLVYNVEKFYDQGYTVGLAGLQKDSAGKYEFDTSNDDCRVMPFSKAKKIESVGDKVVMIFNQYDKTKITEDNVTETGTISGLEQNQSYKFDVRIGTKSKTIDLKANIHLFVSAENYLVNDFDYITDQILRINVPEFVTTGYYQVNGAGAFRYLKDETDYKNLLAGDYNETIYVYNDNGNTIKGSKDGLILNDDGYLVTFNTIHQQDESDDEKGDEERDYSPITDENIDDYFDNQRDDTESLDSTEDFGTPADTTEQDTQKEDTTADSTENTEN